MKKNWLMRIPLAIGIAAAATFVLGNVVMLLWNNILPAVLHVGMITFWQAVGLLALCRLLFGGIKGRRGMPGMWRRKMMWRKWQNMTDEEKERFKQMRGCGGRHAMSW